MRLPKALGLVSALALMAGGASAVADEHGDFDRVHTRTPIKHLVVIFNENISFDHYFGTYPNAQNNAGETKFTARHHTPVVNNLVTPLDVNNHFKPLSGINLLTNNPNNNQNAPVAPNNATLNGTNASNPFRLAPLQALTADQGHNETPEQHAYNNGNMDGFPANTGTAGPPPAGIGTKGLVMAYYDGNTTTALWNYAQYFAMSDNSYGTQFGPSTPGAINLISGQTNGIVASNNVVNGSGQLLHTTHEAFGDASKLASDLTLIGDADPMGDACATTTGDVVTLGGKNIGDLLNARGITWGSFMGGFDLTVTNPGTTPTTGCARASTTAAPGAVTSTTADYIPHHAWFQYYTSTANLTHARPSSVKAIGHSLIPGTQTPEPANHNYDTNDFFAALQAHNLPAVSFLKPPAFQDGHAGYSDPVDEQAFIVKVLNALQESPEWRDTAVVIAYDDSDGWYDHQMPPIVNASASTAVDVLNGAGVCNTSNGFQQGHPAPAPMLNGNFGHPAWGRCGYGTRQPLMVISPFAKVNFVDHTLTDQTSVIRFVEDNWLNGERIQPGGSFDTIAGSIDSMFDFDRMDEIFPRRVILDQNTGAVVSVTGFQDHDRDDHDHDHDHN